MVNIPKIKLKIDKVIDQYGNDIIIRSPGTKTFDEWGEPVLFSTSDVNTVGVTDSFNNPHISFRSKIKLGENDVLLLIKGDETITKNYTFILDSVEYNILSIEPLKVSNIIVAYNVQLSSK